MGARRYGQEGALANPTPSGNVVQCFCALVVTEKRSLDELFMRYFHNLSSASGAKAPRPPPGLYPWIRWGDFIPRLLICPLLEKNLAGAHVRGEWEFTAWERAACQEYSVAGNRIC